MHSHACILVPFCDADGEHTTVCAWLTGNDEIYGCVRAGARRCPFLPTTTAFAICLRPFHYRQWSDTLIGCDQYHMVFLSASGKVSHGSSGYVEFLVRGPCSEVASAMGTLAKRRKVHIPLNSVAIHTRVVLGR